MHYRYFALFYLSMAMALATGRSFAQQVSTVKPTNVILTHDDTRLDEKKKLFFNEKRVPCNVIKLNVGPSLVCSVVETPSCFYEYKLGLGYGIEYQHFWRSGFGVGASMYLFNSHFGKDLDTEIKYMGPTVVYSDYLDSKGLIRADIELGLGCGILKEKMIHDTNTETEFAAMAGVGIEYAVAKNVAFGLQLNWNTLFMTNPKGYYIKDEDWYGIENCSLLTGVRVYF